MEKMVESQALVTTPICNDIKQSPTNTMNPHLPRIRFYESSGAYILTTLLLILYIATAGIHFAFDEPKPYLPLIAALLTPLPYLFRHRFNSKPHLFHQVFCAWVSIPYNLIIIYYSLLIDHCIFLTKIIKDLKHVAFLVYSLSPLLIFQIILSIYTLQSFKYFYLRHHLEVLQSPSFVKIGILNVGASTAASFTSLAWLLYGPLVEIYFWGTRYCFKYHCEIISMIITWFVGGCHVRIGRLLYYIHEHRQQGLPRLPNGLPVIPPVFQWTKTQRISSMA